MDSDKKDHSGYQCGSSVDISKDGRTVAVGCPQAPEGGVVYVYSHQGEGVWVQHDKLVAPEGYSGVGLILGHSVTTTPSEDGLVIAGYGQLSGDVFSYSKNC